MKSWLLVPLESELSRRPVVDCLMSPVRALLSFFFGSILLTAFCQSPGILALRHGTQLTGPLMLLMAIGSSGPTIVAVILSALSDGRAGVRALFARRGQPAPYQYTIALFHVLAAHLIASAALMLIGQFGTRHLAYPPLRPEQLAIAIVAPLGEEYGWRGYALPRLQARLSPLNASLIIGVVWTVWHLPAFFAPGVSPLDLLRMLPLLLAGSVIYTWLYNASGGSMRLMVLAHLGAHIDNVVRAQPSGDGLAPLYGTTIVLALFAIGLVATGRLAPLRSRG
jgi:membrane protease YdiL (CAAX protease family)